MRAVTLQWRQGSKLLPDSDYPTADQILMIHSVCRVLELPLPVGAFETRGTAEEWLLAHHPQLSACSQSAPCAGAERL